MLSVACAIRCMLLDIVPESVRIILPFAQSKSGTFLTTAGLVQLSFVQFVGVKMLRWINLRRCGLGHTFRREASSKLPQFGHLAVLAWPQRSNMLHVPQ